MNITIITREAINLIANNEINLELGIGSFGKITLGDSASVNPILKGDQTKDLFEGIFSSLDTFCNTLSTVTGITEVADAAIKLKKDLTLAKKWLPQIKSDFAFIGENHREEIGEITDVDGSSEQIVSGGVRG